MIDQNFLKTLTILYVEDDKRLSESFAEILDKLFANVILVEDGLSALDVFKDALDNGRVIDAIISDINLPKLNGLDLLEEIRKYDENVPFVYTTAHYEAENLLKAIKLGASEYYIKPLDAKEIITHIEKVCEKRYQESRIIHYQKEIKKYIEVIDQVAIVTRFNENKEYTFANEFFCEVSGYKEEDITGQLYSIMRPEDVSESLYDEMWYILKKGNVYKGKLKHKALDGVPFFVTTTIFPIYDENDKKKKEYISIEFLTTEYENQKREFKKKVMFNLQETRRINTVARNKIDDLMGQVSALEEQMKSYVHYDVLIDKLAMEKKRSATLGGQIKYYEEQVKKSAAKYENVSNEITERIYKAESEADKAKKKNITSNQEVDFVKSELASMEKHRDKLNNLVDSQVKKISDLQEIIKDQEKEIEILEKK